LCTSFLTSLGLARHDVTVRGITLFIALIGACSSSPPQQLSAVREPPPRLPPPDSAPPPRELVARGGACGGEAKCGAEMMCVPNLPGGYCASFCGATGTACTGGVCVETARAGEVCMRGCANDTDCRADQGYVCDPQWKACIMPNMAALVPKACPQPKPERDVAFGASEPWSTAKSPGIYQFEPSAVLASDGGVTAMYITRGAMTEGNVLGVSRIDGKGIATIGVPFSSSKGNHFDPWLARDRKGMLYAVWLGFDGRSEHQEIALATSSDAGATWTTPIAVHDPGDCKDGEQDCFDKPMVTVGVDPKSKSEIVYVMYAGGEAGLRVRASRDGGKTFGAAVTALEGIYGTTVVGTDGRLHVATLDGGPNGAFGSADQRVEYTVSVDGGATFAKPITVSGRDEMIPFFFSNPSIAVDDRRKIIYVAYARGGRDAKWDIVVAATRDAGKTWTRTKLGDDCAIHMVPNVALDPTSGTLHVAWYDSDGGGRFAHATCAVGAASCTSAGAINGVPFAALSTERHGSKWIGEYESLIVDDQRRVLHAVWTQPVDEAGKRVSRIFHASAKLRR
jgi:hypothetical protein